MAVEGFFCKDLKSITGFDGQLLGSIHRKKHLHIGVADLFHVFFLHHQKPGAAYGVEDKLNISVSSQHPKQTQNLSFFKVME